MRRSFGPRWSDRSAFESRVPQGDGVDRQLLRASSARKSTAPPRRGVRASPGRRPARPFPRRMPPPTRRGGRGWRNPAEAEAGATPTPSSPGRIPPLPRMRRPARPLPRNSGCPRSRSPSRPAAPPRGRRKKPPGEGGGIRPAGPSSGPATKPVPGPGRLPWPEDSYRHSPGAPSCPFGRNRGHLDGPPGGFHVTQRFAGETRRGEPGDQFVHRKSRLPGMNQ